MKLKFLQALDEYITEKIPFTRRSRVAQMWEHPNVRTNATVATVQNALRAAEAGDTRQLFALYRDLTIGGSHTQAEFNKRKLALLAQPHAVLPADKTKLDDITAAAACTQMIQDAENWNDGLTHLLDSALWPVTVAEKIFRARNGAEESNSPVPLRYTLRRLEPVNPTVLCFQKPYGSARNPNPADTGLVTLGDAWEADLRFYATDEDGRILYDYASSYPADPTRHIVHRGHLLVGMRDNWGGPMRAILFWDLLAALGRDWFARAIERFGVPFPVGHTDSKDKEAIEFLNSAFSLSTKIGGLVVDHDTQIELKEVAISGLADAHEKFIGICNREISKVIVGQTLSAEAQPTGLGSGTANLQSDVREDIRMFDCIKLGETIRKQIFAPFLRINGLRGAPPKIVWGGLSDEDAKTFADLLNTLSSAGFEPTDQAIPTMNERLGFPVQRKAVPLPAANGLPGERNPQMFAAVRSRLVTLQAQSRMADKLGVPTTWLNPLRDFLAELEAKTKDATLSEEDLLQFLDDAIARVPELFKDMDVDALAEVLEAGMGSAVINEVRRGIRKETAREA